MKIAPADLSRLRGWAVNTPMFMALSLKERARIRQAIGTEPKDWTFEVRRYIEAGKRLR